MLGVRSRRPVRAVVAPAVGALLVVTPGACTSDVPESDVTRARAEVAAAEAELADAQDAATKAAAAFCSASTTYVEALDRYGDVLNETGVTVGDVRTAGEDLERPSAEATDTGEAARDARVAVDEAQQDLAEAQAALAAAEATAQGTEPPPATALEPTPTATVPAASVSRVQQAEEELASARSGITDETPLVQASEQFNAAVVALEMAWLRLVSDAGCLTDEQQAQASATVSAYTAALQQDLADAGYDPGAVDGVYGPQTVAAVEALQKASGLPETGTVDRATEAALREVLAAKSGAAAQESVASTAALQQTLALAGYWDGPVDGLWTDELTAAVGAMQADLGVPVTGTVDAATVAAFQAALAGARAAATATPAPTPSESDEG